MIRLVLSVVAGAALLCGCGERESIGKEPCDVFTQTEAESLLGNPVKKPLTTSTGESCSYTGSRSLLVSLQEGVSVDQWREQRKIAEKIVAVQPLTISGSSEGFSYSAQNGTVQDAEALSSGIGVRILITGAGATQAQAQAALDQANVKLFH